MTLGFLQRQSLSPQDMIRGLPQRHWILILQVTFFASGLSNASVCSSKTLSDDDDDVELYVLGCRLTY